jgi:hypothetical protein
MFVIFYVSDLYTAKAAKIFRMIEIQLLSCIIPHPALRGNLTTLPKFTGAI